MRFVLPSDMLCSIDAPFLWSVIRRDPGRKTSALLIKLATCFNRKRIHQK